MPHSQEPRTGRFAPSPTGDLHSGSLVAALASWLHARQQGGAWLLRVEDIDPPREVAGSAASILAALSRLGLQADAAPLYQSQRGDAYATALQRLRDAGHAFPCWCSRSDLDAAHAIHHELHRDGHCFTPRRGDREPAWRLRVPDTVIEFDDGLQGAQRQNVRSEVGDFVLKRADGLWSYQLACVVDDAFQGITEVVRGCDLLDSTPRQILLQCLLGLPTPAYLHLPLAVDGGGRKLSKSTDAPAIDACDPRNALAQALRFLGQDVPDASDVATMLQFAAQDFDLAPLRGMTASAVDA
ncbi:MAG: tRNA glutamyl-Q(34) synthetase GluQRS [Xanthomonadales bacterium]|nr:tRNA glutamyl-Q(34) synthetase GluQRS [Xanthomonadales bacterium]ODU94828.1 MAG: tRNA glutamyl-Q(34) synthetase GluQRS [Rhodanobacter sp. SCN 66-43]OJY82815.1 MAG: tRNA glutamyl-Q(34) synthetase GluQRS [Xanthomonadales bacterium 66-474]